MLCEFYFDSSILFYFILFYFYYLILYSFIYFSHYSLMCLFMEISENSKKDKFDKSGFVILLYIFWYGLNNFVFVFLHTRVKFCALNMCVICFNNQNNYMVRVYYLTISKRGSRGNFGSILDFPGIPN